MFDRRPYPAPSGPSDSRLGRGRRRTPGSDLLVWVYCAAPLPRCARHSDQSASGSGYHPPFKSQPASLGKSALALRVLSYSPATLVKTSPSRP
jgi:hypothetical protein